MPTEKSDILRMTSGTNTLYAGGGDDTLYWSPELGSYNFHGGDAGERYDTNVYMDKTGGDRLVIESTAGLRLTFSTTENGLLSTKDSFLNFTGVERIHLGEGNDTIIASNAALNKAHFGTPEHGLTLYAGAGNDSIVGSAHDDFIDGGSGNDTIRAGAGSDFIQSSTGDDLIFGGTGNDNIRWGQGNFEEIIGNDTIYGGAGNDLINIWIKSGWDNSDGVEVTVTRVNADGSTRGSAWTDIGGAHSDLRFQGFEMIWTHEGRDTINGANAVIGADGNGFHGNARWGDDIVIGSRGNDTLEGGEGRDTITGGAGNDLISANGDFYRMDAPGDGVRDVLIFQRGFGHDTVLGFDTGIDALKLDSGMTYSAKEIAGGTQLTFASGDSIFLSNVYDFI
ncbi:MAG: hypothetical protein QM682_10045 [Paracoccus sp. (in: a-proteobacteria)]|uniref:calcium-binding protein n=1 Tax=Paracoccus sp. TaxID=267 RepID=UPI0039E687B2